MLIFDSFSNRAEAEAFSSHVKKKYERKTFVFDSQEESDKVDVFPFELIPPIVLVERSDDYTFEEEIEAEVVTFNGRFAGT